MTAVSRTHSARRTAVAALVTVIPSVFVHEIISFAVLRPLIHWSDAGCISGDACAGIAVVLIAHVAMALPVMLFFALAGALRVPRLILVGLWLASCLLLLVGIASGYRGGFGATWLWHEPFVELMFHPGLTPLVIVIGAIAFIASLSRNGARHP